MVTYVLTWLLILLAGCALAAVVFGWPRRLPDVALNLGVGSVVGVLLAGIVVGLVTGLVSSTALPRSLVVLALVAIGGWSLAWRQRSHSAPLAVAQPLVPRYVRIVIMLALALIGLRMIPLINEILLRPVYPWDAWAGWMVKPKAWFLGGQMDRFVDPATWFASSDGLRTLAAASYPELSGRLQLLLAVALGEWNEPLLLLPWLVVYIALLLAFVGMARRLDCPVWTTALGCYAMASMPLINAQVALAGYLDLWVGAVVMLALATWLQWRRERRTALLVAALALAGCLPLLKLEGSVWLVLLLALMLFDRLPPIWQRRALWAVATGLLAIIVVAITMGGWIDAQTQHWKVPGIRKMDLAWRPGGLIIIKAIFSHSNWHLLGLLLVAVPLLRWRRFAVDVEARLLGLFIVFAWLALLMLFCLTPAAEWAVRQTATNRLVMQLVPTMVLWLLLLVRDVRWSVSEPTALALPAS